MTVVGILLSVATAYVVLLFASIMDYVQLLHGIFLAPLFGTFLLGMFWKGTTPWGGFAGLVTGTVTGLGLYAFELGGLLTYGSPMAGNFWRAWWAWPACFLVTIVVSLTSHTRKSDEELKGLVWGTEDKKEDATPVFYKRPVVLAVAALAITVALNVIFW